MALTEQHAELETRQQSKVMEFFANLSFDRKVCVLVLFLTVGVVGGIGAFTGTMTPKVEYCLAVKSYRKCGFKMPFLAWKNNKPEKSVVNRVIKATNPYKPYWALLCAISFGGAGWMLRQLQDDERQLQNYQQINENADLEIAANRAAASVMMVDLDSASTVQQAQLITAAEVEQAKIDQDAENFKYLTAGMTPEQVAEYIRSLQTPFQPQLQGQSLDDITRGDDKVKGVDQQALSEESTPQSTQPSTPQSTQPSTPLSTPNPLDQSSETTAMAILDGIVGSRRSTLLVGGTGAGKSVTQAYILTKFFQRYPDALVWAIAQKNDSFCGLDKKRRVILFDSLDPTAALKVIDYIHSIYDKRRRLPEHARIDLSPVRLILADWLSINQALDEAKNDAVVRDSKYLTKLSDIIYNGRELNVCLLIDLQSFNLAAIGMKADRNSRKNFNLIGLGNYSVDEFGSINESYGVLQNMIGNKDMVPDEEERAVLLNTFKSLKPISKAHNRPIIFTTLEPARVALLPDLRHYKPGQSVNLKPEDFTPEYLEKLYRYETFLDQTPARTNQTPDNQPSQESAPKLTELQQKIVDYLKGKGIKDINSIKDTRSIKGTPVQFVRVALAELIELGMVISEGKDSYRLVE